MGLRFFFDPGCVGRPLWPPDSGGPIGPLPCFPGLVVLLVVLWPYWFSLFPGGPGRPFGSCFLCLCLLDGPIFGPVGPLMFVLLLSVAISLCGLACLGGSPLWSCWDVGVGLLVGAVVPRGPLIDQSGA